MPKHHHIQVYNINYETLLFLINNVPFEVKESYISSSLSNTPTSSIQNDFDKTTKSCK